MNIDGYKTQWGCQLDLLCSVPEIETTRGHDLRRIIASQVLLICHQCGRPATHRNNDHRDPAKIKAENDHWAWYFPGPPQCSTRGQGEARHEAIDPRANQRGPNPNPMEGSRAPEPMTRCLWGGQHRVSTHWPNDT